MQRLAAHLMIALAAGLAASSGHALEKPWQHFVFISDTQYPWTDKNDRGEPEDEDTRDRRSREFILAQGEGTLQYREDNGGIDNVPLFINGDLTAYGHAEQLDFMTTPLRTKYVRNFYINLGNHDYKNNVDDCFNNNCALRMYLQMGEWAQGYGADTLDYRKVKTDEGQGRHSMDHYGSLAYTKTFGDVLAIQLQNEPTYEVKFRGKRFVRHDVNVNPGLGVLAAGLKAARRDSKSVIINMHSPPYSNWKVAKSPEFIKLMKDNEDIILGIFAGHLHTKVGRFSKVGKIPVYLSGAAHYRNFLVADFNPALCQLQVWVVHENNPHERKEHAGYSEATTCAG